MRRWSLSLFLLAACGSEELGEARFSADDCRSAAVIDAVSAEPVFGIEDLAISFYSRAMALSAYDRKADAEGGVYELSLPLPQDDVLQATVSLPGAKSHGLASYGSYEAIVRTSTGVRLQSGIRVTEGGVTSVRWFPSVELPCRANDISGVPGTHLTTFVVTVDGGACGDGPLTRAFSGAEGSVIAIDQAKGTRQVLAEGLAIPNGITFWSDGNWFAEMRRRRIVHLDSLRTINLPGAPDNLTTARDGIVAAVQPSLWRFGLYRYGYTERAATRIVLVNPDTRSVELLFDDPTGKLLSGATAALLTGDGVLIASSVGSDRLLICEPL